MTKNFHRKVLNNGMTVLFEKRDVPVVSVAFSVKSGGINESEEEKGISHFIEHLVYKGTKNRTYKQINEEIEMNGGEMNGFTSEVMTTFWCKMPKIHLNTALDVLSDIVKNPLFKEEDIEKERNVIFEEIKMYKDNPIHHSFDEIHKLLYEKPFGLPLIGTEKSLNSIGREKILERFEKYYRPENMVLTVVGNADFDDIVKFTEKNFDKSQEKKTKKFRVINKNGTKTRKRKGIDQASLLFAFHVPTADKKESYAADVLMTLMGGGMSSRLFDEIREKRNLAYAVKGGSNISKDFAFSYVFVGTKKESIKEVKKILLGEFEKVSESLTEKELEGIKEQMIGNHQISMEDSSTQLVNLLVHEMEGKAEDFYSFEENVKKVKLSDVKKIAKIKNYSLFSLIPED